MDSQKLVQAALDCGATKACLIDHSGFVLSKEFRPMCEQNSCGMYGKCWTCPPYCGDIEELIAKVRTFGGGMLYQYIGPLEDSYDFEGMVDAKNEFRKIARGLHAKLPELVDVRYQHLGAGGCDLCAKCAVLTNEPCRHPEDAMLSMESVGFDVYNTTKPTPLKYINGANTVTYFGIVLFGEAV